MSDDEFFSDSDSSFKSDDDVPDESPEAEAELERVAKESDSKSEFAKNRWNTSGKVLARQTKVVEAFRDQASEAQVQKCATKGCVYQAEKRKKYCCYKCESVGSHGKKCTKIRFEAHTELAGPGESPQGDLGASAADMLLQGALNITAGKHQPQEDQCPLSSDQPQPKPQTKGEASSPGDKVHYGFARIRTLIDTKSSQFLTSLES